MLARLYHVIVHWRVVTTARGVLPHWSSAQQELLRWPTRASKVGRRHSSSDIILKASRCGFTIALACSPKVSLRRYCLCPLRFWFGTDAVLSTKSMSMQTVPKQMVAYSNFKCWIRILRSYPAVLGVCNVRMGLS